MRSSLDSRRYSGVDRNGYEGAPGRQRERNPLPPREWKGNRDGRLADRRRQRSASSSSEDGRSGVPTTRRPRRGSSSSGNAAEDYKKRRRTARGNNGSRSSSGSRTGNREVRNGKRNERQGRSPSSNADRAPGRKELKRRTSIITLSDSDSSGHKRSPGKSLNPMRTSSGSEESRAKEGRSHQRKLSSGRGEAGRTYRKGRDEVDDRVERRWRKEGSSSSDGTSGEKTGRRKRAERGKSSSSNSLKDAGNRRRSFRRRRRSNRSTSSSSSSSTGQSEESEDFYANLLPAPVDSEWRKRCVDVVPTASSSDHGLPSTFLNSVPTFECFDSTIRDTDAKKKIAEDLRVGDEVCVRVRRVELAGIYVQPICVLNPFRRCLKWIYDFQVLIGRESDCVRDFRPNDLIRAVVVEAGDLHSLTLAVHPNPDVSLSDADLPQYFRNGEKLEEGVTFDEYLNDHLPSEDPNLAALYGLSISPAVSLLPELRGKSFSESGRAPTLRKRQNEEMSMQCAVQGVNKIHAGEHTVAIQHFNRALDISATNVEALVGRAAAYANLGNFDLAETDLDNALSINAQHANAISYMVETLLQVAKKLSEAKKFDEARAKYEKILRIKDDPRVSELLRKLGRSPSNDKTKEVDEKKRRVSADEERQRAKESDRERKQRRSDAKKLAEMERFIAQLRGAK